MMVIALLLALIRLPKLLLMTAVRLRVSVPVPKALGLPNCTSP